MEFLIGWIVFSVIAGAIAANKGRSGFGFFLLSMILTPLIGIIAALVASRQDVIDMDAARRTGQTRDFRKCPQCAEIVRREALKCRHCGSALPELIDEPGFIELVGRGLGSLFWRSK